MRLPPAPGRDDLARGGRGGVMAPHQARLLRLLFSLSGFCAVLYPIVWVRLALARYGVLGPVLAVVGLVFVGGLFAGSAIAGRAVGPLTRRTGVPAIRWYAAAEALVGALALALPSVLSWGGGAVFLGLAVLPGAACLGATYPLVAAAARERTRSLYFANSVAAALGGVVVSVWLAGTLGLHGTLLVGALVNFFIAVAAAAMEAGPVSRAYTPL